MAVRRKGRRHSHARRSVRLGPLKGWPTTYAVSDALFGVSRPRGRRRMARRKFLGLI